MISSARGIVRVFLAVIELIIVGAATAGAADVPPGNLEVIQGQISKIKTDKAAERDRVNRDEQVIRQLEQQL